MILSFWFISFLSLNDDDFHCLMAGGWLSANLPVSRQSPVCCTWSKSTLLKILLMICTIISSMISYCVWIILLICKKEYKNRNIKAKGAFTSVTRIIRTPFYHEHKHSSAVLHALAIHKVCLGRVPCIWILLFKIKSSTLNWTILFGYKEEEAEGCLH